jgi:DNA-binding HxlR family transcriptional regulator
MSEGSAPRARRARRPGPAPVSDPSIENRFIAFRDAAGAFVESLEGDADFHRPVDGTLPSELNLEVARSIFGKWSLDILVLLASNTALGFSELRRSLRGISSRILSQKLKQLEAGGLIRRTVVDSRPPRVHYALTDRGTTVTRLGEPVLLFVRYTQGMYVAPAKPPRGAAPPIVAG